MRSRIGLRVATLGVMFVFAASNVLAQTSAHQADRPVHASLTTSALLEAERIGYLRQPPSQNAPAVAKSPSWAGRHPVLLGTLIGMGAGTAVGVGTVASGHPENGEPGAVIFGGILVGAAGGALVGLLVGAVR